MIMDEKFDYDSLKSDFLLYPKLQNVIHPSEQVIWIDKPKRIPFIFSQISKGLPFILFGLIWIFLCFWGDLRWISLIGFYCVFVGLNEFIKRLVGFSETVFGLTKNKILIRKGTYFGVASQAIELESVSDVTITINPLEKLFNAGTVKFFIGKTETTDETIYKVYHCWLAIENPYQVFEAVNNAISERKNQNNKPKKKKNIVERKHGYKLDY